MEFEYYCRVPLYFFNDKRIKPDEVTILLSMYTEYILKGSKGFIDDEGNKINHTFEKVDSQKTFLAPKTIFMLFDEEDIELDHLYSYLYLCYLSHGQKSHVVRIKKELIKSSTGLSKTRFKEVVQELIYNEMNLLETTERNNELRIPDLNPETVENTNDTIKKIGVDKNDSETFSVPKEFIEQYKELGFNYKEFVLIIIFASIMTGRQFTTLDEAIGRTVNSTNEKDEVEHFHVLAAVKKAERKGIITLTEDAQGISFFWNY